MAGILDKIAEWYDKPYWDAQKKMKADLVGEVGAKSYDSMRDSEYDRAQAFATALLYKQMNPDESDLGTRLVGRIYENASALMPLMGKGAPGFGIMDYINDAARDIKNNEAAYNYWNAMNRKSDDFSLTEDQIKDLGKQYAKGLLSF
jgi:hypothetical protein